MLAWAEVDRVDVAGFEGDAGLAGGGVGAAFDKEGVEAGEVVSLEAGQDLFHLLSGVGLVEGQLGEDAVQQLEPEQELVLVVRLQDCDTDPEQLSVGVRARPAWWLSRACRPVGPTAALVLGRVCRA